MLIARCYSNQIQEEQNCRVKKTCDDITMNSCIFHADIKFHDLLAKSKLMYINVYTDKMSNTQSYMLSIII